MIRIDSDATNGLTKKSAADTFQVRSLSENRFIQQIGEASAELLSKIEEVLIAVLEITK